MLCAKRTGVLGGIRGCTCSQGGSGGGCRGGEGFSHADWLPGGGEPVRRKGSVSGLAARRYCGSWFSCGSMREERPAQAKILRQASAIMMRATSAFQRAPQTRAQSRALCCHMHGVAAHNRHASIFAGEQISSAAEHCIRAKVGSR